MAEFVIDPPSYPFIDPPPCPSPRRGRGTLQRASLRAFMAFTVLGLGTSTALSGAAREEVVRDFDKTAALPSGRALRVSHQHGDVVVHTHALPEVRVHATIRASAEILPRLREEYERTYYAGIICERRAKAQLAQGAPGCGANAFDGLREAMNWYEKAEAVRAPGNDDALLRWNACARFIMHDRHLVPMTDERGEPLFLE